MMREFSLGASLTIFYARDWAIGETASLRDTSHCCKPETILLQLEITEKLFFVKQNFVRSPHWVRDRPRGDPRAASGSAEQDPWQEKPNISVLDPWKRLVFLGKKRSPYRGLNEPETPSWWNRKKRRNRKICPHSKWEDGMWCVLS